MVTERQNFPLNLILYAMLFGRQWKSCQNCCCCHTYFLLNAFVNVLYIDLSLLSEMRFFFCSFKNTYHTHTYTCMCPKTINEHSSTLKNTYKSDENKKKKREKERKKNLYVYTYIGHTTGKTTFMSIQYETNVRKQCVFCNRTFHPKRINGEPLIKLCSICAQISAFSNTRSHID